MTEIEFDNTGAAFEADRYGTYAMLRRESPVHRRVMKSGWVIHDVTRYQDVVSVLRDRRFRTVKFAPEIVEQLLKQPDSPLHTLARIVGSVLLVKDDDDHRRLRGLVNKAFTPRVVQDLRPRIAALVDTMLQEPLRRGGLDIIADLAAPLPVIVIAELLGLPTSDYPLLKRWSDRTATFIDGTIREQGLPQAAEAATEMGAYLEDVFAARRREPREDLISGLVHATVDGERLTENEVLATTWLVLAAGHETTTNLIGNGMLAMMQHHDQYERLCSDPSLIGSAVEELLRFDAPVQATSRIPFEDVEVAGRTVAAGEETLVYLASANRDPEVFDDPDRLDIGRADNRHVSFGHGAHFCVGAALARLEAQEVVGALARCAPGMAWDGQPPKWRKGLILRGLERLDVSF